MTRQLRCQQCPLRAKAKSSNFTVYALGVDRLGVVNASTLDIFSFVPNPVLLNQLTELRMLSKAWADKNNSAEPKDIRTKDETFAHRNAMGTGPFMLKNWTPDQRATLVPNPLWWGKGKYPTNVTEIVYTPTNLGRFSNPQQDALIERIRKETDLPTRNSLIEKALLADHALVSHIPLHNQIIPWAMKKTVDLPHRADNQIDWRA